MSALIRTAFDSLSRRELRAAAIHEAGHLVVGNALGGLAANARVWPTLSASLEDRLWAGNVCLMCPPARPKDWRVIFGAAGKVAELLLVGESVDSIVNDADGWIAELSDTDAALVSRWTYDRIERTARLLLKHWPEVMFEARCIRNKALRSLDAMSYSHLTAAVRLHLWLEPVVTFAPPRVLGNIR